MLSFDRFVELYGTGNYAIDCDNYFDYEAEQDWRDGDDEYDYTDWEEEVDD